MPDTLYMCYNSVMKKIRARKSILIAVLILVAVTLVAVSACNDKDSVSFSLREVTVYLSDGENMVLTYTPSVKTGSGNGEYTLSVANPTLAKVSADGKSLILSAEGSVMVTATTPDGTAATMMLYILKYRPVSGNDPDHTGYWEVSFDTGRYGSVAVQYVADGGFVNAVTPGGGPVGYNFHGWYTDPEYKNYFDTAVTPVHASMTLYGFWAPGEATYEYREENDKTYISALSHPTLEYVEITLPTTAPGGKEIYGIRHSAFAENQHVQKIIVPEGIKFIGEDAFSQCQSLKEVVLPATLEQIEDGAFSDCPELTSVTFAESDTLTEIGAECFKNCPKLTSVNLPNSVSSLGAGAFEGDTALTSIDIPDGLYVLQERLFYGSGLTSIDLENRITDIYNQVFYGATDLETVVGYKNIAVMGSYAFGRTDSASMTKWLYNAYQKNLNSSPRIGAAYLGHVLVLAFPATRSDFTVKSSTRLIAGQAFAEVDSGVIEFKMTSSDTIPDYGTYAFGEVVKDGESVPYPSADLIVPNQAKDLYIEKWLKGTTDSGGYTVPTAYSFNVVQNVYVKSSFGGYDLAGGGSVPYLNMDVYMRTPYLAVEGVYFDKDKVTDGKLSTGLTPDNQKVCYLISEYKDDMTSLDLKDYMYNSTPSVGKTAYIDDILPFAFSGGENEGANRLNSVTLPNRISRIHYMAFTDCTSLNGIYFLGEEGLGLQFAPAEINSLSFNFTTLADGAAILIQANYYLVGNSGNTLYSAYQRYWGDIIPGGKMDSFVPNEN